MICLTVYNCMAPPLQIKVSIRYREKPEPPRTRVRLRDVRLSFFPLAYLESACLLGAARSLRASNFFASLPEVSRFRLSISRCKML